MSYTNDRWNRAPPNSDNESFSDDRHPYPPGQPGSPYPPGQPGPPYPPGQPGPPFPPGQPGPPSNYSTRKYNDFLERQGIPTITSEDLQILQKCGQESLYYRCLPLTAAFCTGIVLTARARQWKPSFYHYLGAVFLGYFGGKLSYRSTCEEKLINSRSNSPFVNAIRKRRGLFTEEFAQDNALAAQDQSAFESDWTTGSTSSSTPKAPNKSYGIDEFEREDTNFGRPSYGYRGRSGVGGPFGGMNEFDDSGMAPYDDPAGGDKSPRNSYDDLRARNRSNFKNI